MMDKSLEFNQIGDLDPALTGSSDDLFDSTKFVGHWLNTNRNTKGIAECSIAPSGEQLAITILGAGNDAPIIWPTVPAHLLANLEEEAGQRSGALAAVFQFGFMDAEVYIRVNRGVLVIVLHATFHDGSGRTNYVNREFFFRAD
jgi:hypothetical protein